MLEYVATSVSFRIFVLGFSSTSVSCKAKFCHEVLNSLRRQPKEYKENYKMGYGVIALTLTVCVSGSFNDVLSKLTANLYTQRYAFFVDQGNNFVYSIFA